jgi:predicted DNA-binding transcriptional regulator AlpA
MFPEVTRYHFGEIAMSESERLLRFRDLKERGIVENWPTLKRLVEQNGFPPGRYLGANTRVWTPAEIENWLAARPTTRKEAELEARSA